MELSQKFDAKRIELRVRGYLAETDVASDLLESAKDRKKSRFIEGPPTMNGPPHVGHLRGRIIKDLWYRFSTLRGAYVEFNAGWDTQGLPIELQAEKELGVTGGKAEAIERFGIERIVAECKKIVAKNTTEWEEADRQLGISLDHDKAYRTFDDEFIEREWKILKSAKESGVIREDYTVIAYCPSCQTSLSHAEVGQGYKEVVDPSLYYTVELEGEAGGGNDGRVHLVVWTTMPFTLLTDAMVGVHPDEEYAYVRVRRDSTDGSDAGNDVGSSDRIWIVGKTRLEGFLSEIKAGSHEIIKCVKGSSLDGLGYRHPLRDTVPGLDAMLKRHPDKYHKVVAEEFVDVNAGSGLVHIAPANGEEDIKVAAKRGVEVFCPIDDQVRFTWEAGAKYAGVPVRDTDRAIVDELRARGALVRIGRIKHSYPHCWRSGHALVWLARRGYFYDTGAIGDNVTRAAEEAEYFFEQPRNRFLGIINDRHPWCISRERIWGCPLPVWKCNDCQESTWLYSRAEIVNSSVYLPDGDGFELHRPWIDNVKVRCGRCSGVNTTREDYVLDTWHNSGSAPWSSLDDDTYQSDVPAPFLTEGIDQTRGWAYTLLLENVILRGEPVAPFRAFLFQGHVLDENGQKMSKSKGNVMEGRKLLADHPADMIRLYCMWKASPIEPLSFSIREMNARPHQTISTLYNLHLYFAQNGRYDGFDESAHTVQWADGLGLLREPERWLLSKLQRLIRDVTERNERCRFHEAAKALDDYIVNTFSQTYVRMTRGEIWNEEDDNKDRRLAIYAVLCHVLRTLDVMMHPLCPFVTEYLWQSAFGSGDTGGGRRGKSILLSAWPRLNAGMEDSALEESFDLMTGAISACGAARTAKKLKGRWPLDEAVICVRAGQKSRLEPLAPMLQGQINVEKLSIVEAEHMGGDGGGSSSNSDAAGESAAKLVLELEEIGMPVTITAELNGKSAGPKAKRHMPDLVKKFGEARPKEIAESLRRRGSHDMRVADGVTISLDGVDVAIGYDAAEGYATASRDAGADSCAVFLTTSRNREMTAKGLVKDVARRLQSLRKERGYNPTDMLERASILGLAAEQKEMLEERADELAFLVRVRGINFEETCDTYKDEDIDGQGIRVSVE